MGFSNTYWFLDFIFVFLFFFIYTDFFLYFIAAVILFSSNIKLEKITHTSSKNIPINRQWSFYFVIGESNELSTKILGWGIGRPRLYFLSVFNYKSCIQEITCPMDDLYI